MLLTDEYHDYPKKQQITSNCVCIRLLLNHGCQFETFWSFCSLAFGRWLNAFHEKTPKNWRQKEWPYLRRCRDTWWACIPTGSASLQDNATKPRVWNYWHVEPTAVFPFNDLHYGVSSHSNLSRHILTMKLKRFSQLCSGSEALSAGRPAHNALVTDVPNLLVSMYLSLCRSPTSAPL